MSTDIVADHPTEPEPVGEYAPPVERRDLPQDIPAEMTVLGGMMLSADAIGECVEIVKPHDFYRPAHQAIYECLLDAYGDAKPTDPVAIGHELGRRDELVRAGGAPYLHQVIATVPTAANVDYYAGIVREKALDRRTVETGTRVVEIGYHGSTNEDVTTADLARAAVDAIDSDREDGTAQFVGSGFADVFADLEAIEAHAHDDGLFGVPTGYDDLDEVTNGLQAGQFVIVAGRPGLGKSTVGLDLCRSASIKHNIPSAVFSLEMSRSEITMRMLAAEARVRLGDMRGGRMTSGDWERLRTKRAEIERAPILIDDSPTLNLQKIRARARKLRQRHGVGLIVVDYMQLMTSGKRVESRQQEVSEFSRALKLLAKELEIPVVAVSQLNRGPEQRQDRTPSLADLRESGSQEQDADMVILIHRPDAYERDSPRSGECDLILAKHRAGPQATITVAHQLHYCRFVDMAQEHEGPAPDPAFDREHVRGIDSVSITGDDKQPTGAALASVPAPKCSGCRDDLHEEADIDAGCHLDTCSLWNDNA